MNEAEFNRLVEQTLADLEDAVDGCGVDVDIEGTDGMLTLTFNNGSKIIINRQAAVKQLWVATREGGFHFNYNEEQKCWLKDDDGTALFAALSRYCSNQSGESIQLQ